MKVELTKPELIDLYFEIGKAIERHKANIEKYQSMQCLHLWKPVYDEYIRLGYRLSKDFYDIKPQYTIEDYLGEEE